MSALVKYDAARYALSQAVEIDEVKDIRDKAQAMAAYARQAQDTAMVEWATEIKVRAERKAGQMLAEMPMNKGAAATRSHDVTALPKTLADLDITKNESSRWQKLAAVPASQFEQAIEAAKEVAGEVTTAAMLRAASQERIKTAKSQPPEYAPDMDMVQLAGELQAENEAYQRQIKSIVETDDVKAELVRLNTQLDQLNGRVHGLTIEKNEAIKMAKRHAELLAKIRKALGVESDRDILAKLKG